MRSFLSFTFLTASLLTLCPIHPSAAEIDEGSVSTVSGAVSVSAEALSFEDAWSRLSNENLGLESSRESVDKAKNDRNSARTMYLPKVDLSASYTRIDAPIVIDLDPIRQTIAYLHGIPASTLPPFEDEVQKEKFGKATLTASWVLYTGGKRPAANQAASSRLKDAEAQNETAVSQARSTLVERYFGLRLAREVLSVRRELETAMQRHTEEAKKIEKAGLIAKAERLHAEVASADASMEAQSAEYDVASASAGLESLFPQTGKVEPTSSLFMVSKKESRDEYQDGLAENQPILKRLDANVHLAQAGLQAEYGRFMPDIYVFGQDEIDRQDLTILDPKWAVGVGVQIPLFEGGKRVFDSAAARHQVKSVEAMRDQTEKDLSALVDVRLQELQKAQARFKALESTVELARENERVRTKAFEAGMSTSLEVTDAQSMLAKARLGRLVAAYDYDVALARLLEASGQSEKFEALRKAGTEVKP